MGERGRPRGRRGEEPGRRPVKGHGQAPDGTPEAGQEPPWARHAARPGAAPADSPAADEPPATLRGPGEGRAARRRAAKRIKRRRRLRATREIPLLIGTALLIALVLKTFLVQAFVIPSGSMEETIRIDDRVLVDKLTPWFGWEASRGDVIVFQDPGGWLDSEVVADSGGDPPVGIKQARDFLTWIGLLPSADDQDLIKRVIGVGGDTVVCCAEDGRITVNGVALDEPYLYPGNPPSQIEFEVVVPEGRLFVMGDHRSNSADSRYHLDDGWQGTVPEELVVGRAMVIAWPFGHWQRLGDAEAFAGVPDPDPDAVEARDTDETRAAQRARDADGAEEKLTLPIPAELPLVMGVVGLLRPADRSTRSVRSGSGGCGGGCSIRRGGAGGPSGESGWRVTRRWSPRGGSARQGRRGRRSRRGSCRDGGCRVADGADGGPSGRGEA
ncbi:signal peptidase I [Streptomyces sp. DSM 44915]|uniref:Signal peptidase I n=1 Tax=Streptomyces chisholmiae TaxID=3075540 RepID=A0ABU2JWE9_9ACTN|nr:signal peptidase I [Streptomyces sp. DSM 44915]MDT0269336.1 signal peptidase I [Streptomyces sp. DSM 44915]